MSASRTSGPALGWPENQDSLGDVNGFSSRIEFANSQPLLSSYEDDRNAALVQKLKFYGRIVVIIVASMIIALQSGTPNAFNTISDKIKKDTGISDSLMTLLASIGIIGLFFTSPAGITNDRFGAMKTSLVGSILISVGYVGMSFTDKPTYAGMLVSFIVVGFGSGACFLASLAAGIKAIPGKPGLGVALVGSCMSLSMALTNQIVTLSDKIFDCSGDSCWRTNVRAVAVTTFAATFVPSFFLILLPSNNTPPPEDFVNVKTGSIQQYDSDKEKKYELPQSEDEEEVYKDKNINSKNNNKYGNESQDGNDDPLLEGETWGKDGLPLKKSEVIYNELKAHHSPHPVGMLFSLNALRNIFFWVLILAYFAGISSAMIIITKTKELWLAMTGGDKDDWAVNISTAFAFANAFGNVLSGWGSDFLWGRYKVSRHFVLGAVLLFDAALFLAMTLLSYFHSNSLAYEVPFMLCMIAVGSAFGTYLSLVPIIVGDYYGHVNFGMYFGYIQIGSTAATFLIPNVAEAIENQMGNYNVMLIIIAAVLLVSAVAVLLKRPTPIGHF